MNFMNFINIKISKAESLQELSEIAQLAEKIWHECFVGIISVGQIDYMVEKFQSFEAMKDQTENQDYIYFRVLDKGELCGYFAVRPEQGTRFFLSKLYLRQDRRGLGIASLMMKKVFETAKDFNKKSVYLTVNKHNDHAVEVYKKIGFETVDGVVTDIGNGYVMDDFVMEYFFEKS